MFRNNNFCKFNFEDAFDLLKHQFWVSLKKTFESVISFCLMISFIDNVFDMHVCFIDN